MAADGVPVHGEQDPQCLVARGGGDERREAANRGGAGAWGRRHRHRFRRWRGGTGSSQGACGGDQGGGEGGLELRETGEGGAANSARALGGGEVDCGGR